MSTKNESGSGMHGSWQRIAADPSSSPEQLREAISNDPAAMPLAAINPGVDEPLREWLWRYGGPAVQQAMLGAGGSTPEPGAPTVSGARDAGLVEGEALSGSQPRDAGSGGDVAPGPGASSADRGSKPLGPIQVTPIASDGLIAEVPGVTTSGGPADASRSQPVAETDPYAGAGVAGLDSDIDERTVFTPRHEREEDLDATVFVERRRVFGRLQVEGGEVFDLDRSRVLVGRRPRADGDTDIQIVRLRDPDKTVSKRHLRLEYEDGAWYATDLESTNGTIMVVDGTEQELIPLTRTAVAGPLQIGFLTVSLLPAE